LREFKLEAGASDPVATPATRRNDDRGSTAGSAEIMGESGYAPSMPRGPSIAKPRSIEPLIAPAMIVTRGAGEIDGARHARQLRSPERGPEDIRIHIGRIEVTAAPPAPARPAPAPARKSPSLDEYLKRRPGRAR
jgi:hypothetical protein